jgi:hypothetical protein
LSDTWDHSTFAATVAELKRIDFGKTVAYSALSSDGRLATVGAMNSHDEFPFWLV